MHLHAYGLGQALHLLGREVAPRVEHVKLLLQFVLFVQKNILLHLQFLHLFQKVQGRTVLGGEGVRLQGILCAIDLQEVQGTGIALLQVDGLLQLCAGGTLLQLSDMHHAQFADGLYEAFIFAVGHQKGELLHLFNHKPLPPLLLPMIRVPLPVHALPEDSSESSGWTWTGSPRPP